MLGDILLLAVSFAVILVGALTFTNAVEWLGHKLSLGEGAVGSLLAAVGTAMPESLIPLVAILGGAEGSDDVAIGAIVGAPFLLATVAMFLVGVSALAYQRRRPTGHRLDIHAETVERDLVVFLGFFAVGLVLGLGVPDDLKIVAAIVFLLGYGGYVVATLRGGGSVQPEDTLDAAAPAPRAADHGLARPRTIHRRGSSSSSFCSASRRWSAAPTCSSRRSSRSPRGSAPTC